MNKIQTVLILDDEEEFLEGTSELLELYGYFTITCKNIEEACEKIKQMDQPPDAYLADAIARDPETGVVLDFFTAKKLFLYLQKQKLNTENFYIWTNHLSDEDIELADELGVKILNKTDWEYFKAIFPDKDEM